MSTTHGQPGLSSDQRSTIRSTILSTRHTLEDELRRQLEKYGIYEDKKLPHDQLTHLSAEELHIRDKIDAAIERELASTEGDLERSITNYVREATKTYLNRFVALKTIEVRGLVKETITERPKYGNRSYMHHTVAEIAGELTNARDDGFGAALDLAYQEIGAEIRMIFEESEHTAIDLDAQVREEVLDDLDAIDDDAWESDEALGWVYQYFGEEEREEIDERVDEENYKIAGTDIATKTQLFTPRYIVEWMVDNSLGRLWLEMQGGRTNINDEDNCFYLAPLEDSLTDREAKPVKDITVLDPACGSGHMLFYAFDVLYQMYLEESEVPEKYIPREILRNNLYGVDIDSGAAQIAALSLYLKAKEKSSDVTIPQLNIVSADAVLINGDRKQDVLERASSGLEEEILEQVWRSFENIREVGSLVEVEDRIDSILEDYRETFESKGQAQFTEGGELSTQSTFVSEGQEETWVELKKRLMENVREIARTALEQDDPVEGMFANEVGKTVELLDVLRGDYDIVVSNPPYLGSGKMGDDLKKFVKDNYLGSRDLYAAFIERCSDFAGDGNYVSMVTPENFMFLYSYRKLRSNIVQNQQFIEGAHLSRYGFDQQKDAYTIPFVLRNNDPSEFECSRFYRMTEDQPEYAHYEDKIAGLEQITQTHRRGDEHDDVYVVNQNSFKEIDRSPFIYWFGQEILQIFIEHTQLGKIADVKQGLSTGNDGLFMRKFWEVPDANDDRYIQFQKSGTDSPYYDRPQDFLDWGDSGEKIKNYDGSAVRNEDYYFRDGLTVRPFGDLIAREAHNLIFGKSYFISSEVVSNDLLNGLLNSSLYKFMMDGINPSLNVQVGDLKTLPIPESLEFGDEVRTLVREGVKKRVAQSSLAEISFDFNPDIIKEQPSISELKYKKELLSADILIIQGLVNKLIFDSYGIADETRSRIYENENPAHFPHISNVGELENTMENQFREKIQTKQLPSEEYKSLISDLREHKEQNIHAISEELQISPYTVVMLRREHNIYTQDEREDIANELLSTSLGYALGRWETENLEIAEDGILVFDDNFDDYILQFLEESLGLSTGENNTYQTMQKIERYLNEDVGDWMRNSFFRYYHCKQYRRRGQRIPLYWQLESPEGEFSCFIYYHSINENTLPKLRGQYLDSRIAEFENELETLNSQTSGDNPDKELLRRKEEVQNGLDDIREFRDTIDQMIDDGVTVDVEKGIWENIKEWDQYEVLETGLPKLKSSYSR